MTKYGTEEGVHILIENPLFYVERALFFIIFPSPQIRDHIPPPPQVGGGGGGGGGGGFF